MRNGAQVIFDLVHVPVIEAPIVIAQFVKARQCVTLDSSGHVDVRIEITPDEISETSKQRFTPVQTDIPRPCYRSPPAIFLKNEDHMIE